MLIFSYTPNMKPIEEEKLKQLLQIIPDYPMIRIVHFADSGKTMPRTIGEFIEKKGYEYQINCLDTDYFETLQKTFDTQEGIKPVKFTLSRPRYMVQGKVFEYVFVTAAVEESIREDFLKRVHPIMKNAGNIIIFLPKKDHIQRYEWMRLLEENYYVATNTIDDLFEHYDLLISKKMHGWGG